MFNRVSRVTGELRHALRSLKADSYGGVVLAHGCFYDCLDVFFSYICACAFSDLETEAGSSGLYLKKMLPLIIVYQSIGVSIIQ